MIAENICVALVLFALAAIGFAMFWLINKFM